MSVQPYTENKDSDPGVTSAVPAQAEAVPSGSAPWVGEYGSEGVYQPRGGPDGYLMGAQPMSNEARTKAIITLVLGLASFFFGIVASIPAVIVGHMALNEIRAQELKDDSSYSMALAGTIIGWIVNVITVLFVLFLVAVFAFAAMEANSTVTI